MSRQSTPRWAVHLLFALAVLLALVVITAVIGEFFQWRISPLGMEAVVIIAVGSLLLTLTATRIRRS